MKASVKDDDHLVCAVLSAQVAALRDRIDSGATVELLWRTTDLLSELSGLVLEVARDNHEKPQLEARCATAVAAKIEVGQLLDGLAFVHAQNQDFARQIADCVVKALDRLAVSGGPAGARMSVYDLAALYVSDDQRKVHESVLRQFNVTTAFPLQPDAEGIDRVGAVG